MHFKESDVTNVAKIFVRNVKSNLIIVDTLVKNGNNEKALMLVDFVQEKLRKSTKMQNLLFELFVKNLIVKI